MCSQFDGPFGCLTVSHLKNKEEAAAATTSGRNKLGRGGCLTRITTFQLCSAMKRWQRLYVRGRGRTTTTTTTAVWVGILSRFLINEASGGSAVARHAYQSGFAVSLIYGIQRCGWLRFNAVVYPHRLTLRFTRRGFLERLQAGKRLPHEYSGRHLKGFFFFGRRAPQTWIQLPFSFFLTPVAECLSAVVSTCFFFFFRPLHVNGVTNGRRSWFYRSSINGSLDTWRAPKWVFPLAHY